MPVGMGGGGGGGGGGGRPMDGPTDNLARSDLANRLRNFDKSNCNRVFDSVIDDYNINKFEAEVSNTEFYNVNTANISELTQDQVSGNGSSEELGATLGYGQTAQTLNGSAGSAVLLGPNCFLNSNAVYQGNVLLHELLHAYTNGWSDDEIFAKFKDYGLTHLNWGTEDISAWLSTDCTRTPTNLTWWQ